jgi:predicted tellurium resistance membrane protein TerC
LRVIAGIVLAVVLGMIPLAGVAWVLRNREMLTVDGLFLCLILLTMAGIFFLSAAWDAYEAGWLDFLKRRKPTAEKGA